MINYYKILGLPFTATIHEIKTRFRELIKQKHPDHSKNISEENLQGIHELLDAYKLLKDSKKKERYDEALIKYLIEKEASQLMPEHLPVTRIVYASSLKSLAQAGKLKSIYQGYEERKQIFDSDIFLSLYESEIGQRMSIKIPLPSRSLCPVCYAEKHYCSLCYGIGRIYTTDSFEFSLPKQELQHGEVIKVDLTKAKPRPFTYFSLKQLRIKILIIEKLKESQLRLAKKQDEAPDPSEILRKSTIIRMNFQW